MGDFHATTEVERCQGGHPSNCPTSNPMHFVWDGEWWHVLRIKTVTPTSKEPTND